MEVERQKQSDRPRETDSLVSHDTFAVTPRNYGTGRMIPWLQVSAGDKKVVSNNGVLGQSTR